MCLIFHKWGKWEQYQEVIPARQLTENWGLREMTYYYQKKQCTECLKVKKEKIEEKESVVEGLKVSGLWATKISMFLIIPGVLIFSTIFIIEKIVNM